MGVASPDVVSWEENACTNADLGDNEVNRVCNYR